MTLFYQTQRRLVSRQSSSISYLLHPLTTEVLHLSFRSLFVSSFSFVMDPRDSTVSHISLTELFFALTMYILMALCWMESFGVAGST